jgi:hypothetical protein
MMDDTAATSMMDGKGGAGMQHYQSGLHDENPGEFQEPFSINSGRII